jgi:hypothetical protein
MVSEVVPAGMAVKAVQIIRSRGISLLIAVLMLIPVGASAVETEQAIPSHVFMWSVKGKRCTVYLLGSIHVLKKDFYPLDGRIEKAYASCSRVVFEADMAEAGSQKAREMMLKLGTYPQGQTLHGSLSAKTYRMLDERLKSLGMEISRFEQIKPWLVSLTLATIELKRLGVSEEDGIDVHFLKKARQDSKKIFFLETAGQQIDLLARELSSSQEELLKQSIEELDVLRQDSTDLQSAWRAGDVARVEAITKTSLKGYPGIEKKLFVERNTAWTAKIEKLLKQDGDVFFIVGAAHLVGGGGVLTMLQAKGYTVVQQ